MTNSVIMTYINENKIQLTLVVSLVIHLAVLFGIGMEPPGSRLRPVETTIDLVDLREQLPEPPKPREVIKKPADEPADEPVEQKVAMPSPPKKQIFLPFYKVDQLPQFTSRMTPVYPESARKLGRTGQVILEAYIDKDGRVRQVRILRSGGRPFDEAAIAALKQSQFTPAKVMGNTVPVKIRVPYVFSLDS